MLKKLLRLFLILIAILSIILGCIFAYYKYQENLRKQQELTYDTKAKWSWENEFSRIQIAYVEKIGASILRKVNLEEKYAIYVLKNEDYTFSTFVKFSTNCKPGTKIETSEKFSNGEPKILKCNEEGNSLSFEASWNQTEPITSWSENLNGFKFNEYFYSWNFDKLDREITLKKAK
jgi:hypothetical protein